MDWWRLIPECAIDGIQYRKFASLDNLKIPFNYSFPKKVGSVNDLCIVYCIWDVPGYLSFIYMSLISQFKYTDAENFDIKIFVSDNLYKVSQQIFPNSIEIIPIKSEFNKYSITQHFSLKKYTTIVLCDSDFFFLGKKQNFYKNVSKTISPIMIKCPSIDCITEFDKRKSLSRVKSSMGYFEAMKQFMNINDLELIKLLNRSNWYYSCVMVYPNSIFNNEIWTRHIDNMTSIGSVCDETAFLTFFWKQDINILNFDETVPNVKVVLNDSIDHFNGDGEVLGLIHPLGGPACENDKLAELYAKICNQ